MKRVRGLLAASIVAASMLSQPAANAAAAAKEGRVTQIIRDVKLLPSEAEARPAAVNDQVREGIAVRTGDKSRSELTFNDLTINRLGANTIFSFNKAGRSVQLDGGSILLRVPKDSGGGTVRANAVTVAVTGTTLILETARGGRSKLIVLEGGARLALVKNRSQNRDVRAGQMLDVPAGATTLPMPVDIDLNQVMKTHPLITDFRPLPSRDLIADAARKQRPGGEPVYQGRPVGGRPVIVGGQPFPGLPPFFPGGGNPGGRPSRGDPTDPGGANNPGGSGASGGRPGGVGNPGGTTDPAGGTGVGGGGTTGGTRGPGAVGLPGSGQVVGGAAPSSGTGSTSPILRRTAPSKIAVPRSTPTPIR